MGSLIPYPTALELVAAVASLACFEELAWLGGMDMYHYFAEATITVIKEQISICTPIGNSSKI